MLQSIHIENFAIVDRLDLDLSNHLTILTGETGAGKSIIIDALGLVLGERADSSYVRHGSSSARIVAVFQVSPTVTDWLQAQDLQQAEDSECFVRRVINANGRSRGYINDQPVPVQTLKQLGELLVDIHGQHAHQSLLKSDAQRTIVDAMADDSTPLQQVKQAHQHWQQLQTALTQLGGAAQDREARLSLLRYQVQELEQVELSDEHIQQLNEEHRLLANAHQLVSSSEQALSFLDSESGGSARNCLNQALHALNDLQNLDNRLQNAVKLVDEALIQTEEAITELGHYRHQIDVDPARLQWVEQRIAAMQDLARKHKVHFTDLPIYYEQLRTELSDLEHYEEQAAALEAEVAAALQAFRQAAEVLYQQRCATAEKLGQQITHNLQQLGMPNGQVHIEVNHEPMTAPSALGSDKIAFLVNANLGQVPKPLHKVASGGELSRISLAIQVITAQRNGVGTLVFDEVDVGIGGGVAEIVGQLLRRLGQQRQVLCITHLPQVACQGEHHLQVSKRTEAGQTLSQIVQLNEPQRVEEIARMLGGVEITPQTLAHAQEMLQWRHQPFSQNPIWQADMAVVAATN